MGVFDFVDDVVDSASKVAKAAKAAADWVAEAAENLGLGKIRDVAKGVGKVARKLTIAPTPILEGGQKLIEHMIDQTGEGDPELGGSFRTAGRKFKSLEDVLAKALPGQEWQGVASDAYAEKTDKQVGQVVTLADADFEMARIVTAEAEQIHRVRKILGDQHTWLADFGQITKYLGGGGPPGKAFQVSLETWAVAMAMMECLPAMRRMSKDAKRNATAVGEVIDIYKQVASKVNISDSAGDFDPRGWQPPRRPPSPGEPGRPVTPTPSSGGAMPDPTPTAPFRPVVPVAPASGTTPAPPAVPAAGAPGPAPSTTTPASAGTVGPRQFAIRGETPTAPSSQRAPHQSGASTYGAASIAGGGERAPVEVANEVGETPNPSATRQ